MELSTHQTDVKRYHLYPENQNKAFSLILSVPKCRGKCKFTKFWRSGILFPGFESFYSFIHRISIAGYIDRWKLKKYWRLKCGWVSWIFYIFIHRICVTGYGDRRKMKKYWGLKYGWVSASLYIFIHWIPIPGCRGNFKLKRYWQLKWGWVSRSFYICKHRISENHKALFLRIIWW